MRINVYYQNHAKRAKISAEIPAHLFRVSFNKVWSQFSKTDCRISSFCDRESNFNCQAAYRLYPIMHWTESYIWFSPSFCQVILLFFWYVEVSRRWPVRPVLVTRFRNLFLAIFMLLQIIYQRRQVGKPFSLSYRQAAVKISFSVKLGICNHVCRPVSLHRRILVIQVGKAVYLSYNIFTTNLFALKIAYRILRF